MDELVNQIIVALREDKVARMAGLGSFKLLAVAPRKSVNVVTGEAIIIPGYNKLTFTPEAGVKELFESKREVPAADTDSEQQAITPLQKLGAQADEIVGLLADLGQAPNAPKPEEPKAEEPAIVEPEPVKEPEPVAEPIIQSTPITPITPITPNTQIIPNNPITPTEPEKPQKQQPTRHFLRDTLITLLILLLILAGAFFFFRHELTKWVDDMREKMNTPIENVVPMVNDTDTVEQPTVVEPDTVSVDTVMAEDTVVAEEQPVVEEPTDQSTPINQNTPSTPTVQDTPKPAVEQGPFTIPVRKGEGLMQLARRFYGHRELWVFIYEANKNKLDDPDNLPRGMRILIPALSAEERDIRNPKTQEKIRELTSTFLENKE